MTVMIGHMKRMNIPVRMNTFILMFSCLCFTFTGKDILCFVFCWSDSTISQDIFDKSDIKQNVFFPYSELVNFKQSEMNVPFE